MLAYLSIYQIHSLYDGFPKGNWCVVFYIYLAQNTPTSIYSFKPCRSMVVYMQWQYGLSCHAPVYVIAANFGMETAIWSINI